MTGAPGTLPPAKGLTDDLEYLRKLDALRSQVKELIGLALDGLCSRAEREWDQAKSLTTTALMRRVKHLAWAMDRSDAVLLDNFDALPNVRFSSLFDPREDGIKVPVLFAATYLRACTDDAERLPPLFFLCNYRILYDLYSIGPPDWALGAAKGDLSCGTASAFLTSECARALGHYADTLQRTAQLVADVATQAKYLHVIDELERPVDTAAQPAHLLRLPLEWCKTERERVLERLRTLSETRAGTVFIKLPADTSKSCEEWIAEFTATTRRHFEEVSNSLSDALDDIDIWRKELEAKLRGSPSVPGEADHGTRPNDPGRPTYLAWKPDEAEGRFEGKRTLALSDTCHFYAQYHLRERHYAVYTLLQSTDGTTPTGFLVEAEKLLAATAGKIRMTLAPTRNYMQAVVDAALHGTSSSRPSVGEHDLAMAAACAGSLSREWHLPAYALALTRLSEAVDAHGGFPMGPPFLLDEEGAEHHAVEAHGLRAIAHIMGHVDDRIDPALVGRMISYFRRTATTVANGIAWRRSSRLSGQPASRWVTAVSVLALSRILQTLDAKINQRVSGHFSVVPQWKLGTSFERLMCTDLGIASIDWSGAPNDRPMATVELEWMNRHVLSRRAQKREPLTSMILFGPPGTGKTTLPEVLAKTAGKDLIVVTPGDFLSAGGEGLAQRAGDVMVALGMLTRCVVLFDELDAVIQDRSTSAERPNSPFSFLTAVMLTRFGELNSAAKKNRFVFLLATNYIQRLDAAAIRPGRFSNKRGIYSPDLASRMCRLSRELYEWLRKRGTARLNLSDVGSRAAEIVARTAAVPMSQVCRVGWFTAPKEGVDPAEGTAWHYLVYGGKRPRWPVPGETAIPDSGAASGGVFKNSLEIDQAVEGAVMSQWDRGAMNLSKEGPDWERLISVGLTTDRTLVKLWDSAMESHREARLLDRERASALIRPSAGARPAASAPSEAPRVH